MKNTLIIITGSAVTNLGNSMYVVALLVFVSDFYKNPLSIGLIQAAAYLPIVLFSLKGGMLADSANRPYIISGTDTARSLFLAVSALLLYFIPSVNPLIIILPLVFFNAVMQAFFTPAAVSYILDMKRLKRDLLSIRTATAHLASLSGQILGSLLYPARGLVYILALNSVCFLISGISELFLRESGKRIENPPVQEAEKKLFPAKILKEFVQPDKKGSPVILYFGMQAVNSLIVVNLPFYITERLGFDNRFIGFSLASLLGGSIISGFLLGISGYSSKAKPSAVCFAALLSSFLYSAASLLQVNADACSSFFLPASLLTAAGASLGFIHLLTVHSVFMKGPRETAAARQGFLEAVSAAVLPLSYLAGSFFASRISLDTPLILRSAALISLILSLYGFRSVRK